MFGHQPLVVYLCVNECIYIDGLGHKPFKSGQAFFSER